MVALCAAICLVLASANLAAASLWHDELVHVFVARSVVETGEPRLPSGYFYTSGMIYNYVLAGWMAVFGDGERAVRTPSTIFAALNVVLAYLALRRPAGRRIALLTAACLALSPVAIAWAREARFYALQQTFYLLFVWCSWLLLDRRAGRRWPVLLGLVVAYVASLATAFHSVIFVGLWGGYAAWQVLWDKGRRLRWFGVGVLTVFVAIGTLVAYYFALPGPERGAIFGMGDVLGGVGSDNIAQYENPIWQDPFYYFQWLSRNHSTSFFVLFGIGTLWILVRRDRGAVFTALAFWVPFIALSFLIDYRRERFIFFAFPFYLALASGGFWLLWDQVLRSRERWWRGFLAVVILVFLLRTGVSAVRLIGDSMEAAAGADMTLARRHPKWREPCHYVREHLGDGVVLSTTFLPALYYVGQCDGMYPSERVIWEWPEMDKPPIRDLDALKAFIAEHPRGFLLTDRLRFDVYPFFQDDIAWLAENTRRIGAVSNDDITVYAWPKEERR